MNTLFEYNVYGYKNVCESVRNLNTLLFGNKLFTVLVVRKKTTNNKLNLECVYNQWEIYKFD